jgi:hypothetical protein
MDQRELLKFSKHTLDRQRITAQRVRSNSGIAIDAPFEVDSSRCELSRSPGSRFFGLKLPSQRIIAPVAYSLRSSALTVAGPPRFCTGFPNKTESQAL